MSDLLYFFNQNIDIKIQEFLNNKYLSTFIILFIALYAGLVAIKIPKYWTCILDSHIFKLIVIITIGYIMTKNCSIAIVLAIAFYMTMNTLNKHKINDKIMNIIIIDPINNNNTNIPVASNVPNTVNLYTNQIMEHSLSEKKPEIIVDPKIETNINPNIETKINPKIETKIDSKIETKIDPKIETNIDSKIETKINPKIETKIDSKIETKIDLYKDIVLNDECNKYNYMPSMDGFIDEKLYSLF